MKVQKNKNGTITIGQIEASDIEILYKAAGEAIEVSDKACHQMAIFCNELE